MKNTPTTGYLIFTTHDMDELDATLITDKQLFKQLIALKNPNRNDKALEIWNNYQNEHSKLKTYLFQAPGNYQWPFNNTKILGTYYLLVY